MLEQGLLTSSLSMDPKKILHVEETGKTPLIFPEPSKPDSRKLLLCHHTQQAVPLLEPRVRGDVVVRNLHTRPCPFVLGSHQTVGLRRRKEKVATNQEQSCYHTGRRRSLESLGRTQWQRSGPTGKGHRARGCTPEVFSFHLYSQA